MSTSTLPDTGAGPASVVPEHTGRDRAGVAGALPPDPAGSGRAAAGPEAGGDPVRFTTKIAVLLRGDLLGWQRLNVTAFLVSGLAGSQPELLGEPYADADGTGYLPMFRQPVLVFAGDRALLTAAHARAVQRGVPLAVFTEELFGTGNDRDNRAAVRAVPRGQLNLVGLALHAPRSTVDKVLKGARLHT